MKEKFMQQSNMYRGIGTEWEYGTPNHVERRNLDVESGTKK